MENFGDEDAYDGQGNQASDSGGGAGGADLRRDLPVGMDFERASCEMGGDDRLSEDDNGEHESETEGETEPESGEVAAVARMVPDKPLLVGQSQAPAAPVIHRGAQVASHLATSGKPKLTLVNPVTSPQVASQPQVAQPQVASVKPLESVGGQLSREVATEWRVEWRTVSADSAPLMARLWLRIGGKWLKATRALVAEHQIDVAGPLIFEIHSATAAEAASIKRIGDERIKRHLKAILNRGSRQRNARVS